MRRNTYAAKATRSRFSNRFLLSFTVLLLGLPLGQWELMAQGNSGGNSGNNGSGSDDRGGSGTVNDDDADGNGASDGRGSGDGDDASTDDGQTGKDKEKVVHRAPGERGPSADRGRAVEPEREGVDEALREIAPQKKEEISDH